MAAIKPGEATHVYIAIKRECGCVVAGACDYADKATGKYVADFIRTGYHVERVTVGDARTRIHACVHRRYTPRQMEISSGRNC